MKKVVSKEELKNKMLKAIDLICDTVGSSLGPSGNNVLIDTDEMSPFITNDGVTIARYIEDSDKCVNAILEIIKEASLKTDEKVGDGTTTTLVLLKSIYKEGLKEIEKGKDAIILRKELELELDNILKEIYKLKMMPTKKDLERIAYISSNDKNISSLISEVFGKVKNTNAIKIEESKREETYYEIKKGYTAWVDISPLYFNDKKITLSNAYVLFFKGYLDNLEVISPIINEFLNTDKNLIIMANDIDDIVKQELLTYNLANKKNIYLFDIVDYASKKEDILDDLAFISNAKIKDLNYEKIYFNDLGYVDECILTKDEIVFISKKDMTSQLNKLKKELKITHDDYEKEFINERISKLEYGQAVIYVGGKTKIDKKEKKMHFIDALSSFGTALNGVVIGEGITFYKVSDLIDNKVMKSSLKEPLIKIFENAGVDYKTVIEEIKRDKVYNFETGALENNSNVIDSMDVLIEALKNAISIASILLTTKYLVINENEKTNIEF